MSSECCGAMVYEDYNICSECLEHCSDELELDLEEVDVITDHLPEVKCGMDSLVESLSDKEAEYWEMKAEVHFGL